MTQLVLFRSETSLAVDWVLSVTDLSVCLSVISVKSAPRSIGLVLSVNDPSVCLSVISVKSTSRSVGLALSLNDLSVRHFSPVHHHLFPGL